VYLLTYLSFKIGKVKNVLSGHVILVLAQPGTMQVNGGAPSLTSLLEDPTPGLGFKPESVSQHINPNAK
jgi:hypothetical protein